MLFVPENHGQSKEKITWRHGSFVLAAIQHEATKRRERGRDPAGFILNDDPAGTVADRRITYEDREARGRGMVKALCGDFHCQFCQRVAVHHGRLGAWHVARSRLPNKIFVVRDFMNKIASNFAEKVEQLRFPFFRTT